MTCMVSFSKFSDVLSAFTCARAIGNVWSIFLGVNTFKLFLCVSFVGNIPLLKALWVNSRFIIKFSHIF